METGYIEFIDVETDKPIIEVKIIGGTVWMTISKNLKAIFKDNLLRESDVTKEYRYTENGGEYIRIYYNLETIIFLSFRTQSLYTKAFREWVLNAFRKYSQEHKSHEVIVIFNTSTRKQSLKTLN